MKKIYFSCIVAFLIIGISSCTKYEPIYGVAGNTTTQGELKLRKDLVYIHRNDIYLVNEILADEKRLTSSPTSSKTHVALSPNLDKIAYLNANGTPVIIDNEGNHIETLQQYTNVTDILWHPNNGVPTLVLLVNNNIVFHGPSLNLPSNPFDFAFPSDVTFQAIDAIDINEQLDVLFTFRYLRPYSTTSTLRRYYHGAAINFKNSSYDKSYTESGGYFYPSTVAYHNISYPYYHSIKYNDADQTASLGGTINRDENDYRSYSISKYRFSSSSSSAISSQYTSLSSTSYYIESEKGHTLSNPYQVRKFLHTLPQGVPPPVGTANTYTIDFNTQNTTAPTYFDWQPQ